MVPFYNPSITLPVRERIGPPLFSIYAVHLLVALITFCLSYFSKSICSVDQRCQQAMHSDLTLFMIKGSFDYTILL